MTNIETSNAVLAALEAKDSTIAALDAQIVALTGATPVPVPAPAPAPAPSPLPSDVSLMLYNMTKGSDGIYRSNNLGGLLKCYAQFRTPHPASYIKLTCKRRTNVIPNQGMNLKIFRAWPDGTYPDDYVGRGPLDGAYKFTTELPTSNLGWFSIPYQAGVWINEVWELDYAARRVSITIGGMTWDAGNWNPGTINRTQFGVQCVISSDPAPQGLSSGAFCEFDALGFVWR